MKLKSKIRDLFFKILYRRKDFLAASARHYDLRVMLDPKEAMGGMWEELGALQFDYLRNDGMTPERRMLDIGCGTLRGGRHFIRHLDEGNYHGMDISSAAIKAAKRIVEEENLSHKNPKLWVNEELHLRFSDVRERYDILLAQAVFTHLERVHIEECFANIPRIMNPGARFYFTYKEAETETRSDFNHFAYPFSTFAAIAENNGLRVERRSDYSHPRGQVMAVLHAPDEASPSIRGEKTD